MPKKIDEDRTHGEKLISLFALLIFSGKEHSLTDLAHTLNCSKPTVMRLVDVISRSYMPVDEETRGLQKFYRIVRPKSTASVGGLSQMDCELLDMCRNFTMHILGKKHFDHLSRVLTTSLKSRTLGETSQVETFGVSRRGSIDYTMHEDKIALIIEAIKSRRVCKVRYASLSSDLPHSFHIEIYRLFTHRETLYIITRLSFPPGVKKFTPTYNPILAVHRIKNLELTEHVFMPSETIDFDESFNSHFGLMRGKSFEVEVQFRGWAADYVAERSWSANQTITRTANHSIRLRFTATSTSEVARWIMSFGELARVISPENLRENIVTMLGQTIKQYADPGRTS